MPELPPEVAAAPPDARFGRFVRVRRLGSGGMGEVWQAWDTELARWVAVKFLRVSGDESELARFQREARVAARLSHPNIAAVYDVGEDRGRHWIAMQLVAGRTLHAFPRKDLRLTVRLIRDAARAVDHAHRDGIIHRDLKPENIMLEDGGAAGPRVYVMDFGLARPAEGATVLSSTGTVVGVSREPIVRRGLLTYPHAVPGHCPEGSAPSHASVAPQYGGVSRSNMSRHRAPSPMAGMSNPR